MSEKTSEQEIKHWKQKYYDHLDLLDQKENDWQALESILKKTVLRLSIAAEGQHAAIDRNLHEIRSIVKKQVNVMMLDNILDDISTLLLKLEDQQATEDRKVVIMLTRLLENINFSDVANKQKNKLIKKLAKTSDKYSDNLIDEVQNFLSGSINQLGNNSQGQVKSGFLSNLFGSNDIDKDNKDSKKIDRVDENKHSSSSKLNNYDSITNDITRVAQALPWPEELGNDVDKVLTKMSAANIGDVEKYLENLLSLVEKWQQQVTLQKSDDNVISIDTDDVSLNKQTTQDQPETLNLTASSQNPNTEESEPSAQEILIRLLEQLTVPPDLHEEVESLKYRIENESSAVSWKHLLKDVAQLINTLRNQMQEEKHDFETFLQQITGRLQEMDSFLSLENTTLIEAEQAGDTFDEVVSAQVQDIHDDMNAADDLNDLKNKVEKRLTVVSDHIKEYRIIEQERYTNAQQNVEQMQSRLVNLEQESGNLRKLIIEKNKEAMFDVLTKIPNRLAYEKKAVEEIARCNRFATTLSMAVWDVDLFKQVNDNYGHKVGDKVLMAVAQLLEERMRETDFIARYGGEEFVMFLPGTKEDEALVLTEALREKIAACKFNHHGEIIRITVSCGISNFIENDNHESMFERADKALYEAKHKGRNQCVTSSSLAG